MHLRNRSKLVEGSLFAINDFFRGAKKNVLRNHFIFLLLVFHVFTAP